MYLTPPLLRIPCPSPFSRAHMYAWAGIGSDGVTGEGRWRISRVNAEYRLAPTYPSALAVPAQVTDEQVCPKLSVARSSVMARGSR